MADFDLAAMPELERRAICGQHPTLQHQHDDASKAWDEAKSAYLTVARLDVPKQEIWSETPRQAVDDGMAFSPWNGLAAHQPVGSIMRTRRLAYPASANFRLEKKGCPFSRWPFWSFRDWIGESNAAANQWGHSLQSASERIIATFRAFELQHRSGRFLRPIARAPEHPIAATSCFRNVSKGLPE